MDRSPSGRQPRSSRQARSDAWPRRSSGPRSFPWDWAASAGMPEHDLQPVPGSKTGLAISERGYSPIATNSDASGLGRLSGATTTISPADRSSSSSPRRINSTGVKSESKRSSLDCRYLAPSPFSNHVGLAPVCSMKLSKTSAGNGHAGLVVVPRPRGKVETAGQLRTTMIAEAFLANFSQTAR